MENKGYEVFIPSHNVSCKGIVRYVDRSFTDDKIKEATETHLVNCKLLHVKRLNRRVVETGKEISYVPTGTICITFSGKMIPKKFRFMVSQSELYHITPVMQCHNCLLYGHRIN